MSCRGPQSPGLDTPVAREEPGGPQAESSCRWTGGPFHPPDSGPSSPLMPSHEHEACSPGQGDNAHGHLPPSAGVREAASA